MERENCGVVGRYLFLSLLTGCLLDLPYGERADDDDDGGGSYHCPTYTATIFEPVDGATLPPDNVVIRARWNEPGIPDRYSSLSDDYGNYFPFADTHEILGDGSFRETHTLPAGGAFNFEVGWFCDAGNDGPTIKLASVRFYTSP